MNWLSKLLPLAALGVALVQPAPVQAKDGPGVILVDNNGRGRGHYRGYYGPPGHRWRGPPPPRAYYYAPPRAYYYPPPRYYAPPPPVVYAPPPRPYYYAPPPPPGVGVYFNF